MNVMFVTWSDYTPNNMKGEMVASMQFKFQRIQEVPISNQHPIQNDWSEKVVQQCLAVFFILLINFCVRSLLLLHWKHHQHNSLIERCGFHPYLNVSRNTLTRIIDVRPSCHFLFSCAFSKSIAFSTLLDSDHKQKR